MQEINQDDLTFKYFVVQNVGEFEFPAALHDTGSIYLDQILQHFIDNLVTLLLNESFFLNPEPQFARKKFAKNLMLFFN